MLAVNHTGKMREVLLCFAREDVAALLDMRTKFTACAGTLSGGSREIVAIRYRNITGCCFQMSQLGLELERAFSVLNFACHFCNVR